MQGFDAREWLSSVSAAAKLIQSEESLVRARRESLGACRGASLEPTVSHTPANDPMSAVDDLIDLEGTRAERLASAEGEVSSARAVFSGMRGHGGPVSESGVVLELVYADLVPVSDVARSLRVSPSTVRRRRDLGIDWLDANGPANVRGGGLSRRIAAI